MTKRPDDKPRTAALQAKVPVVKSAKLPAIVKHTYRDFDDWQREGDAVLSFIDRDLLQTDRVRHREEHQVTQAELDHIKRCVASLQTPHWQKRWKTFDAGWEFWNREELYEECPESEDLLGYHEKRVLTRRVVRESLALAFVCINQEPKEGERYTRMLVEEILVAKPSAPALESTCRQMRRTLRYLPNVPELLEILLPHMEHWSELQETDSIDQWLKRLNTNLTKAQAKFNEQEERRKQQDERAARALREHHERQAKEAHERRENEAREQQEKEARVKELRALVAEVCARRQQAGLLSEKVSTSTRADQKD